MAKKKLKLSPSRTKTFFDCSTKYWYSYLGVSNPDGSSCGIEGLGNDGSRMGTCTHAVLECLSNLKRRERVEEMIKQKNPWCDEATLRLAGMVAKREGVYNEECMEKIRGFILAALQEDFYCDGADSVEIEKHFHIEGDGFELNGFIDKAAISENSVRIIDYKTSKKKFNKEELKFNLQNYFYTYAAKQLWPGKPITFDFQFLKFAPKVTQQAPFISDEEMHGFSVWLKEVAHHIDNLTFEQAKQNIPKDKGPGAAWQCGKKVLGAVKEDGSEAWYCDFRKPFIFFCLVRDGNVIKTSRERSEIEKAMKEGDELEQKSHAGCWAWRNELNNS